jgi:hypothetical protein
MFFSFLGAFTSCSQDLSLSEQQEIVRNDADYKLFVDHLKKSQELALTNYFGNLKLEPEPTRPPATDQELVEYLRQSGVKHPEEFVQLKNDLAGSMSRMVKKHDFLREKSTEEQKVFFKTLLEQYGDANLSQEFLLNALQKSKQN